MEWIWHGTLEPAGRPRNGGVQTQKKRSAVRPRPRCYRATRLELPGASDDFIAVEQRAFRVLSRAIASIGDQSYIRETDFLHKSHKFAGFERSGDTVGPGFIASAAGSLAFGWISNHVCYLNAPAGVEYTVGLCQYAFFVMG